MVVDPEVSGGVHVELHAALVRDGPKEFVRVCMPVETDDFSAAPSRSSLTSMVVSLVLLALPAARVTPSRRSSEAATSIPSTWSMHLRRHRAKDLNVASTM